PRDRVRSGGLPGIRRVAGDHVLRQRLQARADPLPRLLVKRPPAGDVRRRRAARHCPVPGHHPLPPDRPTHRPPHRDRMTTARPGGESRIVVANAPISYGAFEVTVGIDPNVPDGLQVLDQVAAAGYAGIDLGPVGYLGTGEELGEHLEARRL